MKRHYHISILLLLVVLVQFLTACDKIPNPFKDPEPDSVVDGLPGVWKLVRIDEESANFRVRNEETGIWTEEVTDSKVLNIINDSDPEYTILKFDSNFIISLTSTGVFGAPVNKNYPYAVVGDDTLSSDFFPQYYAQSSWTVSEMKSKTFVLTYYGRGFSAADSNRYCEGLTVRYYFLRLK